MNKTISKKMLDDKFYKENRLIELNELMIGLFTGSHMDRKAVVQIMNLVKTWEFTKDGE